ncbi:MAG TPA: hypothetical protein VLX68_08180 [Chitinivibrionales bacterium]|nr:hypothetical protein [Chitinivibrionales bacterium]
MKRILLCAMVGVILAFSGSFAACGSNNLYTGTVNWVYQNANSNDFCFGLSGCSDTYIISTTNTTLQNQLIALLIMAKTAGFNVCVNYDASNNVIGIQVAN